MRTEAHSATRQAIPLPMNAKKLLAISFDR
jgi:hypothetical protein